MRVQATNYLAAGAAAPLRRSAGGGGTFSVSGAAAQRAAAPATAPRAVASLDVLMALQAVDDPVERRRRAVRQGRATLDALDEMKAALLGGHLDAAALGRLKQAAECLGESSGDPDLDAVMAEIGLRAAVELAKFTRR